MTRIQKLAAALPGGCGGALILTPVNRRYFTGFSSSDGVLFVSPKGAVFLTDSRYIEAARAASRDPLMQGVEIEEFTGTKNLLKLLRSYGAARVLLESEITVETWQSYKRALPGVEVIASSELSSMISGMRCIKEAGEIERMARAAAFEDPRFPALDAAEWPHCSLHISVLGPLSPCPDPARIVIGRHGLLPGHAPGVLPAAGARGTRLGSGAISGTPLPQGRPARRQLARSAGPALLVRKSGLRGLRQEA